jgi:hypothetical protein
VIKEDCKFLVPGMAGIREGAGLGRAGVEALVELAELWDFPLTPFVEVWTVGFLAPQEREGGFGEADDFDGPGPPREGKSPSERMFGGMLGFLRCLGDVVDGDGISS